MMRIEERGARSLCPCTSLTAGVQAQSSFRNPQSAFRNRTGVTLVELLITILILSMLAAMILGVAAVAGETAREAKTRNMISRLHTLLVEHADSYKDRRVKVRPQVTQAINNLPPSYTSAQRGQMHAAARLNALRELILMEMPDRWSDVWLGDSSNTIPLQPRYLYSTIASYGGVTAARPELPSIYLRKYLRCRSNLNQIGLSVSQINDRMIENQGAECLYMIITLACGDGEARSLFHESDIGDTDEDGAPEFLDGWGNPISFLLWAPGFDSDLQANANLLDNPETGTSADAWQAAANSDHDPNDIYRVHPIAYRLLPLIYSAGGDEEYGLHTADNEAVWTGILELDSTFNPLAPPVLNPYLQIDDGNYDEYLGTAYSDKTSTDNIHNHSLSTR